MKTYPLDPFRRAQLRMIPHPTEPGGWLLPVRTDARGRPVYRVPAVSRPRLPCWLRMQLDALRITPTASPSWDVL